MTLMLRLCESGMHEPIVRPSAAEVIAGAGRP